MSRKKDHCARRNMKSDAFRIKAGRHVTRNEERFLHGHTGMMDIVPVDYGHNYGLKSYGLGHSRKSKIALGIGASVLLISLIGAGVAASYSPAYHGNNTTQKDLPSYTGPGINLTPICDTKPASYATACTPAFGGNVGCYESILENPNLTNITWPKK